ncbi:TPA: hypothetical protein R1808_001430, partial [Campylobacter jejuni]|nr:hypothetical protein [Campylobacter jejuni]
MSKNIISSKVSMGGGNHSSSKKLVLSLVTISFLSSYSYATNTITVNSHETNTKNISNSNNIVTITNNGTITISNARSQAVNFQS